jgi:hypothetical protein
MLTFLRFGPTHFEVLQVSVWGSFPPAFRADVSGISAPVIVMRMERVGSQFLSLRHG